MSCIWWDVSCVKSIDGLPLRRRPPGPNRTFFPVNARCGCVLATGIGGTPLVSHDASPLLAKGATRAETAGALLHDIGKVDGPEGALRRAWMTIDPRPGATTRRYRDHERLGAGALREGRFGSVTVSLILGDGTEEVVRTLKHADSASGFRRV